MTAYPVTRGESISIKWARNNHPGGFVRFAWAPVAQSSVASVYDNNVQLYTCFEIPALACLPAAAPNQAEASDQPGLSQQACGTTITIPTWLADGTWTLQWAWFGGYALLGDYYSCVDYQVSGGSTLTTYPGPYFLGGDRQNPTSTNECLYRNTNRLGVCVVETCATPIFASGVAQNGGPTDKNSVAIPVGTPTGAGASASTGSTSTGAAAGAACTMDSQCQSGVCDITGACSASSKSSHGLTAGGIAAIVFAMLCVVVVVAAALFFYVNKREIPYMAPFKGRVGTTTA